MRSIQYVRLGFDSSGRAFIRANDLTYSTLLQTDGSGEHFVLEASAVYSPSRSGSGTSAGYASLDLSGTVFSVAPSCCAAYGVLGGGYVTYEAGSQVVRLQGCE